MASTSKIAVTKVWLKVSDNNCLIYPENGNLLELDIYVGSTLSDAHVSILIDQPTNFNFGSPVWCRLKADSANSSENIVVIK